MSIGIFANMTTSVCTAPLLDQSLFNTTGGYLPGRYCGLGSFEIGASEASCCFPCPMQDWVYSNNWRNHLRIPNYLSILSIVLCSFLLLSFLILPPAQSHRHYLSIGLLIPVLLISLSFAIPVSTTPNYCYDAITPFDMHDSMSCAWTGSLVTLGGLGCVIWVFLRSLWLFVRIVYDVAPGRKFMFGSIAAGTLLPIAFLIAVLSSTGFSYRMGSTCLPNHENAISTFWAWLVVFAILGFLLQIGIIGYCIWIYTRTLRRERLTPSFNQGYGRSQERYANMQTWANIKKLFVLQWRNILVSVFVLIGSLVFFIVFWTQDSRLGKVFNDPANIKPVKTWILCQILSKGDKQECRKYVSNFTVNESAVVTALILASLVGIELFILLFRASMFHAWADLFTRLFDRHISSQPPTPPLTSLDSAEMYSLAGSTLRKSGSRFVEGFEASGSSKRSLLHRPNGSQLSHSSGKAFDPTTVPTSPTRDLRPPTPPPRSPRRPQRPCQPLRPHTSSTCSAPGPAGSTLASSTILPAPPTIHITSPSPHSATVSLSPPTTPRSAPKPLLSRLQTHRHSFIPSSTRTYQPTRPAPIPPRDRDNISKRDSGPATPTSVFSCMSHGTRNTERSWRDSTISALDKVADETGGDVVAKRGAGGLVISAPVEESFKHVDGAFVGWAGKPFVFGDGWENEEHVGKAR